MGFFKTPRFFRRKSCALSEGLCQGAAHAPPLPRAEEGRLGPQPLERTAVGSEGTLNVRAALGAGRQRRCPGARVPAALPSPGLRAQPRPADGHPPEPGRGAGARGESAKSCSPFLGEHSARQGAYTMHTLDSVGGGKNRGKKKKNQTRESNLFSFFSLEMPIN